MLGNAVHRRPDLKDTVEDGVLHDLWTDVKMTVEALVEHESSRKSEMAELGLPKGHLPVYIGHSVVTVWD